ncbi:MAG: hypothetical protein NTW78_10110 [Campylobacterales bacterium]|nr:hypothetical protein [Campylobacterales bacterium]
MYISIYKEIGKTMTLFQYLEQLQKEDRNALYISLDYPFLSGVDLIDIVEYELSSS